MANNSAIVNSGQPQGHFQQPNSAHHCKECGLFFDSGKSLEVHLQYHKENLLNKWATQAAQHDQETNNNTPPAAGLGKSSQVPHIKREFPGAPVTAAADSSDSKQGLSNKSPDSYTGSRATPETTGGSFGHPPTPQSYHSAPSPYGEPVPQQNYSPGHFSYQQQQQQQKNERGSPQGYGTYGMYQEQWPNMEQLSYPQDYPLHKMPTSNANYRYHPYGYERSPQVSSSSPAYSGHPGPGQPTPSPSPKQCDKCGCVCDSASQLIDHLNHAHPPTPSPSLGGAPSGHFTFPPAGGSDIKQELKQGDDEPQTEILDLDSHKVHHVFQSPEEEEELKRNGEMPPNPHSVTAMLGHGWAQGSPHRQSTPQGIFGLPAPEATTTPMQQQQQVSYMVNTNGGQDMVHQPPPGMHHYRPFEHMPPQPSTQPVISSTQLQPPPTMNGGSPAPGSGKGTSWKSNEARRPKTYNCSACNKWFTSSGHLKRHYNTTLHKNAVKSSGQPDPASLPISAHHHPGRDERSRSGPLQPPDSSNHSPDSVEDVGRSQDDMSPASAYDRAGGLLQQPPSGPYDRHLGPGPPLHSPGAPHTPASFNMSSGSPPNGEAGPSALHQDHLSRGLLSISTLSNNSSTQQPQVTSQAAFSLYPPAASTLHMMSAATSPPGLPDTSSPSPAGMHHQHQPAFHPQQQMSPLSMGPNYPNVSAPHVTPAMVINSQQQASTTSLTITGDLSLHHYEQQVQMPGEQQMMYEDALQQLQPLPSFAQFQSAHHRYGILLAPAPGYHHHQANVGGAGPATDSLLGSPYTSGEPTQTATTIYVQAAACSPTSPSVQLYRAATQEDYEITVLESAELPTYSPQGIASTTTGSLPASPPSPDLIIIKSEPKSDYEHGSPQITSTGSPAGGCGGSNNRTTTSSKSGTTASGLHKCFDCNKVFNKACYLTQHNKTFHNGDKPFKCHRCGKRFPSEPSYQEHLAKHAGDKPYKCELCPKQFNHKTDLRRHMCLHTGQKPYACGHCGKGFIRKDHMLKHAETHSRKSQQHNATKHHQQLQQAAS